MIRTPTFRAIGSYSKASNPNTQGRRDFFGILDVTSKDIAGALANKSKLNEDQLSEKYNSLLQSRKKLDNEESNTTTVFGSIRLDKDNMPKIHGQFDTGRGKKLYDTVQIKQMFVPEESEVGNDKGSDFHKSHCLEDVEEQVGNAAYMVSQVVPTASLTDVLNVFKLENPSEVAARYVNQPPLYFHFRLPFDGSVASNKRVRSRKLTRLARSSFVDQSASIKSDAQPSNRDIDDSDTIVLEDEKLKTQYQRGRLSIHELDTDTDNVHESERAVDNVYDDSIDRKYDIPKDRPEPIKAIEYLKQVRARKIEPKAVKLKRHLQTVERPYSFKPIVKLDSQGFKNYSYQVPDWRSARHIEILNYIRGSILYHNYDILAINKPYGIASHEKANQHEPFDMNSLVQEIALSMRIEKVFLVHRLDKTTTGVLLFATSKERAQNLNKLFKADDIKKTYWCITKGVPNPDAALIDIPVGEFIVAGKTRSCLAPERTPEEHQIAKRYREARRAITEYEVIRSTRDLALVEVKTKTGVKHQIRCHLAFGLNTPILGDHKYSHVGKIAPQKLPTSVLRDLHLRQAKVRTLPLHLHAKSIVIPGAKANGETLFIKAPLPQYFVDNLKTVKLLDTEVRQMASE